MKIILKNTFINILPLFLYASIAFIFWGMRMMPDLTNQFFGLNPDPKEFIWMMHWWPYAIKHGLNPFFTEFLWAPYGYNITEITSIPFISLIMLPIAKLYGYIAAFNLITIFASALSAYTAYLLCKNLTRSFWPALFGGYFFGFSSYQIAQIICGHINLSFTMMLPLIILLIVNQMTDKIKTSTFVILISICAIIEFLISKEIFLTFNFFLWLILLATFFVCTHQQRNKIINLAWILIISYIITAIIISPFLYYFLFHSMAFSTKSQLRYSANILQFFIPTNVTWLGGNFFWKFTNTFLNAQECGTYFGLPLIITIILYIKEFWKTQIGKILTIAILITAFCSLGAILKIGSYFILTLPWVIMTKFPIFIHALTIRFILFSWLGIAALIALWLHSSKIRKIIKYSLVICSIIFILPNPKPHDIELIQKINSPPFIKNEFYKKIMKPHDIMLVLPMGILDDVNNAMLWQIQTNMYFRLATGTTGGFPNELYYPHAFVPIKPFFHMLVTGKIEPKLLKQLKPFIKKQHVAIIAIKKTDFPQFKNILSALKIKPIASEKYLFYQTKYMK